MTDRPINIDSDWDDVSKVWRITSEDVPRLSLEALQLEEVPDLVRSALGWPERSDADPSPPAERPIIICASRPSWLPSS
jgi:hypothetical protein